MFCYNSSQNEAFAHPPMAYIRKNLNKAIYVASHFVYINISFFSFAFARLSIISKILLFEKNDMPLDEEVVVFDGSFQCLWW